MQSILFFIGGLILIYLGYLAFQLKEKDILKSYKKKIIHKNSFFVGLGIAASSPIVIAFWISLSGSYLLKFTSEFLAYLNILFIVLGFVLLHFILSLLIHITRHKIPPKHIVILSRVFGIVLIFYGCKFFLSVNSIVSRLISPLLNHNNFF